MVYWNRFISYIYRYHCGNRCENVGFAKVAKNGRNGRLTIGIKNSMNVQEEVYEVYIYRETLQEASDADTVIPVPVSVGRMRLKSGHGEECFSFDWDDVAGSGRPITAFAGIAVRRVRQDAAPGFYESDMFFSSWTDSIIDYSVMWKNPAAAALAVTEAEPALAAESDEEIPDSGEEEVVTESLSMTSETDASVARMLAEYEKLPLLPANTDENRLAGVIESVKITPNDIGLLDMANWKLGVNSFLTHGYYSYKYLMLGKVIFTPGEGNVSYILGVPGVYSSREKYLAGIFGFDRFVSERETQIKTGSFGYWIVDIR